MIVVGMDMVRLNFSHGTHEEHRAHVDNVKKVREELGRPVGIILDTKGPCIRTGTLAGGEPIRLFAGDRLILTEDAVEGSASCIHQSFPGLSAFVHTGSSILLDDGQIELVVDRVSGPEIICTVQNPGTLGQHKQLNIPDVTIPLPIMTTQDEADLRFGIELGIDYVAASFIRNEQDVRAIRAFLDDNGGADIGIMSKIENAQAIENIEEIIAVSDAIMVARGDLGVEVDPASVPHLQKKIVQACNRAFCPVVIATHMLDSMIRAPHPTRAEVTDVANAIYDGADALMLSGETAIGTYPQLAIKTMARIAQASEPYLLSETTIPNRDVAQTSVSPMIAHAAVNTAEALDAHCIVTPTLTGRTALLVSNFRPKVPIYAVTASDEVARKLSLCWGVKSIQGSIQGDASQILAQSEQAVVDAYLLNTGDLAIFTLGDRETSPETSEVAIGSSRRTVHATNVVEVVQIKASPSRPQMLASSDGTSDAMREEH
jgi:pyruvate kinase